MLNSRLISMLIGLGMLGACGDADDRKLTAQNDNGTDISVHVSDRNGSAKIEGKFQLPAIKLGTSDVDIDGVKLYPGARVTSVDLSGEEGVSEGGVTIHFDADATPASIRDYYIAAFQKKGVTATAHGNNIAGRDHDGKAFSIALTPQAEGTRGVMKLGTKPS